MTVAAAVLVALVGAAIYEFVVVLPAIERWRDRHHRQFGAQPFVVSGRFEAVEVHWVAPLLLIGGLVFFILAVATLVVLRAPAVVEAFRSRE
jgi:hypothetical protein